MISVSFFSHPWITAWTTWCIILIFLPCRLLKVSVNAFLLLFQSPGNLSFFDCPYYRQVITMKKSPADKCPTRILALCLELCGATKFSVVVSLVSWLELINIDLYASRIYFVNTKFYRFVEFQFCTIVGETSVHVLTSSILNFEYEHLFNSKLITEAKQAADLISVPELDPWIVFVLLEPGGAFLIWQTICKP